MPSKTRLAKETNSYSQKEINTFKAKNLNCVLNKDLYWPRLRSTAEQSNTRLNDYVKNY